MDKIVLIYPSFMRDNKLNIIPPVSLIYIGTPLKEDFEIKIIDQRIDSEWRSTLQRELSSDNVICAGISTMSGPQILGAMEVASIVRNIAPSVPIVWGGVHPSLTHEETIKNELVDIVVVGDGEDTFRELVEAIQKGKDKRSVDGIVYKDGESIIRTQPRKEFSIRYMAKPAYDLLDMESYNFIPPWAETKTLPVQTSRGCPMRCSYCYNTEFSQKKWRSLSPEQTVSLFNDLVTNFNIRSFSLLDDNFFVNLKRVRRICELIIENNLKIDIHNANCRVDTIAEMDDDFLLLMKKAGIKELFLGVESGSNRVLSYIKKDITIDQVLTASTKMKNAGIKPYYSFMTGFPTESIDDIKKTLLLMNRLLKDNPSTYVSKLQLFTPFPGTELFHYAEDLGMKLPKSLTEWSTYHYDSINFKGFNNSHEKFLKNVADYTLFLDDKLLAGSGRYFQMIARFYSKILKSRIDHDFYYFMYELYPLKGINNMRKKLSSRNNR
jgi:radical SAM superfamily enzyme YgiQ (UPF0313 family)